MGDIHKTDNEDSIDLSHLEHYINAGFDAIGTTLFRIIRFFLKFLPFFAAAIVIGAMLGYFMDKAKTYDNEIIVSPNFNSVDYLYSRIDLLESRLQENDSVFLKAIGLKRPGKLLKIEIEPIVDIYPFINSKEANFEMVKLMSESSDMSKIIEDKVTSKNYMLHRVSFITKGRTNFDEIARPILAYLNDSPYYKKMQVEYVKNAIEKMQANQVTIDQINGVLDQFAQHTDGVKNPNLVYYNENSQLNDVIKTKDQLTAEQGGLRIEMVNMDKIIKDKTSNLNIKDKNAMNGNMKFIVPLLFSFILLVLILFIKFYKTQSIKAQNAA